MEGSWERGVGVGGDDGETNHNSPSRPLGRGGPSSFAAPNGHGSLSSTTHNGQGSSIHSTTLVAGHQDLPFLVTHFLSRYEPPPQDQAAARRTTAATDEPAAKRRKDDKRQEAVDRIRRAASDLASSFELLGAFNTLGRDACGADRPTAYADLARRYAPFLLTNQGPFMGNLPLLDSIVRSSGGITSAHKVGNRSALPWSLLEAAYEGSVPTSGRICPQTKKVALRDSAEPENRLGSSMVLSGDPEHRNEEEQQLSDKQKPAEAMRRHLRHRIGALAIRLEVESTLRALGSAANHAAEVSNTVDTADNEGVGFDTTRVSSQLHRRLQEQNARLTRSCSEATKSREEAKFSYINSLETRVQKLNAFPRQLFKTGRRHFAREIATVSSMLSREYSGRFDPLTCSEVTLSALKTRLSHAVTISCHLIYPIYCLKFDKSGQYFLTGADDQVVKLFKLGYGYSSTSGLGDVANMRGAVLVCTLRGHAGVVTDIDVSPDNRLVATASGDGDVRVWGLHDGRPIALLRGHVGGANMVSWSTLVPNQVCSVGEDGSTRIFDVSMAIERTSHNASNGQSETRPGQHPEGMPAEQQPEGDNGGGFNPNAVIDLVNRFANNVPGDFVANDVLEKGVALVAELRPRSVDTGRSSRSNQQAMRVMCIARCPLGGKFATGSGDGCVHVWTDADDYSTTTDADDLSNEFDVEDATRLLGPSFEQGLADSGKEGFAIPKSSGASQERLITTLRGHAEAVTDIVFSNAGDRLLTASMKDGAVFVWSLTGVADVSSTSLSKVSQLSIQLVPVCWSSRSENLSEVSCDGVAWTCDDSRIVTSQSCPSKSDPTEIVTGSQMINVWDSRSGKCLMGILSSHDKLCSTIAPHPTLPAVVAFAGADGKINVWDLDKGDCFFSHVNILNHGPVEPVSNRGSLSGFLDIQFSPDGLLLVATDESGRVTILDALSSEISRLPTWMNEQYFANDYYELAYNSSGHAFERGSGQPPHLAPQGVRCNHEGVGYSEHARRLLASCGLEGPQALPDTITRHNRDSVRMARYLMQQKSADLRRDDCRMKSPGIIFGSKSIAFIDVHGSIVKPKEVPSNGSGQSRNSTVRGTNNVSRTNQRQLSSRYQWREDDPEELLLSDDAFDEDYQGGGNRSSSRNVDVESSDEELVDHVDDDEGYTLRASRQRPRSRRRSMPSGSNSRGQRRRRRNREGSPEEIEAALPSRQSSRQTTSRRRVYNELGSDDEGLNELMSTNTTPSGPFATDWTIRRHIFKMPRGAGELLDRGWLSRQNYPGSHLGKRAYCPQVGDSVVYVPRAHEDTLREFPSIGVARPCKSWPVSSSWPVVRCEVLQVRHRFPYERYRRKVNTVSLIVTLRITGIPKANGSQLRPYPWPSPEFQSPSTSDSLSEIQFDVTMFECNQEDFVIPCDLFCWRVRELERAIEAGEGNIEGLRVALNYPPDDDDVDDPLYDEFEASLLDIKDIPESDLHMEDSGYNSILAKWTTEDGNDEPGETLFSVWQVHLLTPSCDAPVVPMLSSEEKVAVSSAYHAVTEMSDDVERLFNQMPDISTYTDYLDMIECPMYLNLIQERLSNDYYSSMPSVIADFDLICDNALKYNEEESDIYELARQMRDKFVSLVT